MTFQCVSCLVKGLLYVLQKRQLFMYTFVYGLRLNSLNKNIWKCDIETRPHKIYENAEFLNVEDISSQSLTDVLTAIMASRLN